MSENKKFCIIGTPVAHSGSPALYRRIFDEHGFTGYSYVINEIKTEEELLHFLDMMREGEWAGCNVTMPWKTAAFEHMDVLLDNAALTGAVNTVINRHGLLYGDSTDGGGMCDAIRSDADTDVAGRKVVVLGCGGAARSIIAELALRNAANVSVFSRPGRNRDLTKDLITRFMKKTVHFSNAARISNPFTAIELCDFEDERAIRRSISDADILINCTPLGMAPHDNEIPIPEDTFLSRDLIVAEAIYNPDETLLVKKARKCGCRIVKGIRMLELQAERAAVLFLRQ